MVSASHVWLNRMAETLVGSSRHHGSEYKSATFRELGTTKGSARWNEKYAERTGRPKRLPAYQLRRGLGAAGRPHFLLRSRIHLKGSCPAARTV